MYFHIPVIDLRNAENVLAKIYNNLDKALVDIDHR